MDSLPLPADIIRIIGEWKTHYESRDTFTATVQEIPTQQKKWMAKRKYNLRSPILPRYSRLDYYSQSCLGLIYADWLYKGDDGLGGADFHYARYRRRAQDFGETIYTWDAPRLGRFV